MSFVERKIDLTITLGSGEFGENLGDTVTLSAFRCYVDLAAPGGDSMGVAQIRIYGLRPEVMNKLTTIGQINRAFRLQNTVLIAAGDEQTGMQTVFQGTIYDAVADYNSSPDVALNILAYMGYDLAVKPVGAISYKGATEAAQVFADLATEGGYVLENNGVSVTLASPYIPGSTLDKIRWTANAAAVNFTIDRGVLAVWPRGSSRKKTIPKISSDTGMIGYPSLSSKGMTVHMEFNWNILLGGDVEVQSAIPMACGTFRVFNVSHSLSCMVPNGPWETIMECYDAGQQ